MASNVVARFERRAWPKPLFGAAGRKGSATFLLPFTNHKTAIVGDLPGTRDWSAIFQSPVTAEVRSTPRCAREASS